MRPHPHIGLATVTCLFDGTIVCHDSLGTEQPITPGDVNWMTAGRGISHSERSHAVVRRGAERLSGIRTWMALRERFDESASAFAHHAAAGLPVFEGGGAAVRLVAGGLMGGTSPVATLSDLCYADAVLASGAALPLTLRAMTPARLILLGGEPMVGP